MSVSTTSIIGLLTAIINFGLAIITRISRPTARQRAAKAIHDARAASATGDATTVNAITEKNRVEKQLLILLPLLLLLLSGCGCSLLSPRQPAPPDDLPPAIVVVPADRYQYMTTNEAGVVGWFVPLAVHIEFMEAVALVDYYRSQQNTTPNKGKK